MSGLLPYLYDPESEEEAEEREEIETPPTRLNMDVAEW